jgi:hypothetical protein
MKECPICYELKLEWTSCFFCKNEWCLDCHDRILEVGVPRCPMCRKMSFEFSMRNLGGGQFECRVNFHHSVIMYCTFPEMVEDDMEEVDE